MRILVVGSTGTIGSRLSSYLSHSGAEVTITSRNNDLDKNSRHLDLADIFEFIDVIKKQKTFDAAVLCAAVSSLRDCERDPKATSQVNIDSQVTLAETLLRLGTEKVVFLSSNRVFNGRSPCTNRFAAYSFTTEYGRQKAKTETELLGLGQGVRVIRLTKVFSEDNSLLRDWVSKLKSGQEIKALVDVMVSPVTLDDTVKVITDLIESENESVSQFSATDEISYFDMARFVAKFLQVDVRLVSEQLAEEVGETSLEHASLECSRFRSVVPSTSVVALQKVLEKMVSS